MGASAQDMLHALLNGETDPVVLAKLARGNMRSKRPLLEQALQGRLTDHHRFLIRQQLAHIQALDQEIEQRSQRNCRALSILGSGYSKALDHSRD
jgi:transposase